MSLLPWQLLSVKLPCNAALWVVFLPPGRWHYNYYPLTPKKS